MVQQERRGLHDKISLLSSAPLDKDASPFLLIKNCPLDLPGALVVATWHFHCGGLGSWGTKIPKATQQGQIFSLKNLCQYKTEGCALVITDSFGHNEV